MIRMGPRNMHSKALKLTHTKIWKPLLLMLWPSHPQGCFHRETKGKAANALFITFRKQPCAHNKISSSALQKLYENVLSWRALWWAAPQRPSQVRVGRKVIYPQITFRCHRQVPYQCTWWKKLEREKIIRNGRTWITLFSLEFSPKGIGNKKSIEPFLVLFTSVLSKPNLVSCM